MLKLLEQYSDYTVPFLDIHMLEKQWTSKSVKTAAFCLHLLCRTRIHEEGKRTRLDDESVLNGIRFGPKFLYEVSNISVVYVLCSRSSTVMSVFATMN